jgi:hypothetical protein
LIHGCVLCHCCGEQRMQTTSSHVVALLAYEIPKAAMCTRLLKRVTVTHGCYVVQRVLLQVVSPTFSSGLQSARRNVNRMSCCIVPRVLPAAHLLSKHTHHNAVLLLLLV